VASSWVIVAGAVDVVADPEPGAVVDRRLDPTLGKRYRLVEDLALDDSWGFSL